MPKAKVRGGGYYSGNQQFAGCGLKRSCGRCSKHVQVLGGGKRAPYGWVCAACKGPAK